MIQCPECRSLIPDDSAFCDQCGKELKWCPECHRPKRGTECPVCGSVLGPRPQYTATTDTQLCLVGNGWKLLFREGEFGRVGGIWPELASCPYVSGRHGVIGKRGDGWTITDSGSTNGTFINGSRLTVGAAAPVKKGDSVRIATLDFTVE